MIYTYIYRPRMEKSHSKRHDLLVCWIWNIVMVLKFPPTRLYLHYWFRYVSLSCLYHAQVRHEFHTLVNRLTEKNTFERV